MFHLADMEYYRPRSDTIPENKVNQSRAVWTPTIDKDVKLDLAVRHDLTRKNITS